MIYTVWFRENIEEILLQMAAKTVMQLRVHGRPSTELGTLVQDRDSDDQGCPFGPRTNQKPDLHHCWALTRHEAIKIIFRPNVKLTSKTDRQLKLKIRVKGSE